MALSVLTSWKSSITHTVDPTEGFRVTLRAERGGTVATTANETGEQIRVSGLIPTILQTHPDNASMTCREVDIKNDRGPKLFDWVARYEWRTTEIDETGGGTDIPEGWSFRRSSRPSQQAVDRDIVGHAIMTVTRESPNPPLTEEYSDIQWVFTTTGRTWNEQFLDLYEDAVNSDVFRGAAIGQCKIVDIQAGVSRDTDSVTPKMDVSITMVVGRPPPAANLYELLAASPTTWTAIAQPAAYYTWRKRWRAEGMKKLPSGISSTPVDANVRGEDIVPRLHDVTSGALLTSVEAAQWYTHRTKPFMSFQALFANL